MIKNRKSKKNYKPGNIIFWRGHVGICLKNNAFIHAYGPRKKVLIMKILSLVVNQNFRSLLLV